MKLWEYEGKRVRVVTVDDQEFEGRVSYYTSALDNDPDPESITIGDIEFFAPEIKSIELI